MVGVIALVYSVPNTIIFVLVAAVFVLGSYLGWTSTEFSRFVCYVGTKGVQWSEAKKNKQNIAVNDVFLFETATDLRKSLTENYTNNTYQGTDFTFKWFNWNEDNKTLIFNCSGKYKENFVGLSPKSYAGARFLFAQVVEQQWTEYLLAKYVAEIESGGVADFRQGRKSFFRVGNGFVELQNGNKIERIDKSNLDLIMSENNENRQNKITIMEKKVSDNSRAKEIVIYPNELSNFSAFIKIVEEYFGNVY